MNGHSLRSFLDPSTLAAHRPSTGTTHSSSSPQDTPGARLRKVFWFHSGGWRTGAAISYVGVHNAWSFARLGIDSQLVIPSASAQPDVAADLADYYAVAAHPRLRIEPLCLERRWWHLRHPLYVRAERLAQKAAAGGEPLLVLTREPRFLPALARLARRPNVIALYEPHYLFIDQSWRDDAISAGDRKRGELERRYLPQISGLLCITAEQARLYRQQLPELPIHCAPLGTKPELIASAGEEESWRQRRTLAYIGHLRAFKGVDALVGLSRQLQQRRIRASFFGGTAEEAESYRRQDRGHGGEHSWQPFLPPAKMFSALAASASVGVVALEDTFYNRHLTCPVKALDFLSLGMPVVAADLPSTRQVLGDAAYYFAPGDMDGLLAALSTLLDSPTAYRTAAAASRRRAEQLAWPTRARGILDFAARLTTG
jgi:glycosyltransferase involved in cell wall biosynthesis